MLSISKHAVYPQFVLFANVSQRFSKCLAELGHEAGRGDELSQQGLVL